MAPLEHRHVLRQTPLAHPPERPQEVSQPRPRPLHRVAMLLTPPVTVGVDRITAPRTRVVYRHVDPAVTAAAPVVAAPLVGVHRRPREARPVHELVQLVRTG